MKALLLSAYKELAVHDVPVPIPATTKCSSASGHAASAAVMSTVTTGALAAGFRRS